jgi:hypothetical protein
VSGSNREQKSLELVHGLRCKTPRFKVSDWAICRERPTTRNHAWNGESVLSLAAVAKTPVALKTLIPPTSRP